jgi:hypothetical protein
MRSAINENKNKKIDAKFDSLADANAINGDFVRRRECSVKHVGYTG